MLNISSQNDAHAVQCTAEHLQTTGVGRTSVPVQVDKSTLWDATAAASTPTLCATPMLLLYPDAAVIDLRCPTAAAAGVLVGKSLALAQRPLLLLQ